MLDRVNLCRAVILSTLGSPGWCPVVKEKPASQNKTLSIVVVTLWLCHESVPFLQNYQMVCGDHIYFCLAGGKRCHPVKSVEEETKLEKTCYHQALPHTLMSGVNSIWLAVMWCGGENQSPLGPNNSQLNINTTQCECKTPQLRLELILCFPSSFSPIRLLLYH